MPEQLVPNIYDVMHSAVCSPWLRRVLTEALSDTRDPNQVAREARLAAALLDARAENWRHVQPADVGDERQGALVDVFLPLDDLVTASPAQGRVPSVEFPNTAWRSNAKA